MAKLSWRTAGLTDAGLVRGENQDNYYISSDYRLVVVADGMGGAAFGALASKLAVQAAEEYFTSTPPPDKKTGEPMAAWLTEMVSRSNMAVLTASQPGEPKDHMGTTMVAAYINDDGTVHVAHVGDSRAYMVRGGKTVVLTEDHSVVMEMVKRGQLTPEQARHSPFRHLITRCLGHNADVQIDHSELKLQPGDWIVLASDGLSSVVEDAEVGRLLEDCDDPEKACQLLLEATNEGGAPDNVTIIAVKCAGVPAREEASSRSGKGKTAKE